jgi:hypothetical protein
MDVQTFFADASVERFDRCIVRRFAPSTEIQNDAVRIRPNVHRRAHKLRSVVTVDALRQTAFKAQALERGHRISTGQAVPDVDG